MKHKKLIESFLGEVENGVFERVWNGEEFAGYKIVEGRSVRQWGPEAEERLKKDIGEEAYTKKLIGITEAEKKVGKTLVNELAIKPRGKPTLVLESDKRISISNDVSGDFEVIK